MKPLQIGDECYVRYMANKKFILRANLSEFILKCSKLENKSQRPWRIIVPFDGIEKLVTMDTYKAPKRHETTNYQSDIGYDELCPVFSYAFQFENHVW